MNEGIQPYTIDIRSDLFRRDGINYAIERQFAAWPNYDTGTWEFTPTGRVALLLEGPEEALGSVLDEARRSMGRS